MGPEVNKEKTKYKIVTRRFEDWSSLKEEKNKFKLVKEFKCLRVTQNNKNNEHKDINEAQINVIFQQKISSDLKQYNKFERKTLC